jgi:drug/metabolite transporter (DMT)-like permease
LIASLALFCSVGAYVLMNVWQPHVPATDAGLIYTIEPVFTAIYVLFVPRWLGSLVNETYPNETITIQMIIGGSLILAANALMQWKTQPHLPSAGPT